ncbi:MAG: ABC transporter permease [Gemmatimonadetes bacterium]|nr:ABC transporter permease [Gemmatimonadota bacterium]
MPLPPAWRSLARFRALTAAILVTLALGVGALTTAFGIVHAALWRQPPFEDARRLALLYLIRNPVGEPTRRERWSFERFRLLQDQQHSFEYVAHYTPPTLTLAGDGDAETVVGEMVSSSYFPLLRVNAVQGRVFLPAEDNESGVPVVLVSHRLVARRWPADPALLGRSVRVNGVMLTVIGVLPQGFHGLSGRADLWVPAPMAPRLTYADYLRTNQNFISVVGRLRPGVTLREAQSELAVLGATINGALPSDPRFPDERVTATAVSLNDARSMSDGRGNATVRFSLMVFFGAVVLLHLLACANVANLLLGRAAAKRHESAVRVALGSGRGRLFAQLLADGAGLAQLGGSLGVGLAWQASALIAPPANVWAPRNFYGSLAPFDTPAFHLAELSFGIGVALATAVIVALPAAVTALRFDVTAALKTGSRGLLTGGLGARGGESVVLALRRPSLRGVLVALEAALAMLLVVAAGLLIDSYQRMRRTDIGVDTTRVLTFWVIPPEASLPPGTAPAFVTRLLDAVSAVPGVLSATVDGGAPLAGTARSTLYIQGRPAPPLGQAPPVLRHYVAPNHFRTMGIPLLAGRTFTASDVAGAPRVTIISETAARRFWPDQDPLGQRVWFGGGSSFSHPDSSAEIVGIVADVVYEPLDLQPNRASFYTPYAQFTYASRMFFLRTAGNPVAVLPGVRRALATVSPDLSLRDVQPLTEVVNGSWARHRFDAILFGGFGVAALLLAATGVFAVLAYAVTNRTREFGVRIALGARPSTVVRLVMREGMVFPSVGLLAGTLASLGSTRVVRAALYEVSPLDPGVYAQTTLLLLAVAAAACIVPAWRATRADPMEALRAE